MAHIFICYSRHNQAVVNSLSEDLGELGHNAWFDRELSGGQLWWDQILQQIRNCEIFILALAPEALESQACKREYSYATRLGKTLLPVLVAEGVSLNLLPPVLSTIQHVDYRQQDRKTIIKLIKAFNSLPLSGPLPEPLPEPPEVPISYLGGLKEEVETPRSLSFEEQAALVLKLKEGLPETDYPEELLSLFQQLRSRDDTLFKIANEIDSILAEFEKKPLQESVEEFVEPKIVTPRPQQQPAEIPPQQFLHKTPGTQEAPRITKATIIERILQKIALSVVLGLHLLSGGAVAAAIAQIPRWNSRGSYHYADGENAVGALVAFVVAMALLWFIRRKIKKTLANPQQVGKLWQKLFAAPTGRRIARWMLYIALLLFLLPPGIALLQTMDRLNVF